MNKFDRIYDLYRILNDRKTPISIKTLTERLECSEPTIKRIIRKLREEFGAPIKTLRGRGYLLEKDGESGLFELPGLWFNASELYALLSAHHLLSQVDPGLLSNEIAPLRRRIRSLLEHRRAGSIDLVKRVRIASSAKRPINTQRFRQACTALMRRHRLRLHYHARGNDERSQRDISPQRLTHYRDNWYLDAWCHSRKALRSFSFERIERLITLQQKAREIDEATLSAYSGAYGIFSGLGKHQATLLFSPKRARWLAEEHWHPDQTSRWLPDGRFELTLPYDNPTELIMDILRYGPDVEVISPDKLRNAVYGQLKASLANY